MKKKELFIIFLVSVVLWFVSGFIYGLIEYFRHFQITGSCDLTGFPISKCTSEFERDTFYSTLIINLILWLVFTLIVWKIYKIFNKKKR